MVSPSPLGCVIKYNILYPIKVKRVRRLIIDKNPKWYINSSLFYIISETVKISPAAYNTRFLSRSINKLRIIDTYLRNIDIQKFKGNEGRDDNG